MWLQRIVHLPPRKRGFHLITQEIVSALPELRTAQVGLLHLLLQHTSASLTLNENCDPDVRLDLQHFMSRLVPDGGLGFRHIDEGMDDMPAHVCASLLGSSLSLPVTDGRLALGRWQGIYLGEHRLAASGRQILATLYAE